MLRVHCQCPHKVVVVCILLALFYCESLHQWRFWARANRAALFHDTWGAAGALKIKIKNHLGREAVFYYLSYNCVGNWQIGAPAC